MKGRRRIRLRSALGRERPLQQTSAIGQERTSELYEFHAWPTICEGEAIETQTEMNSLPFAKTVISPSELIFMARPKWDAAMAA